MADDHEKLTPATDDGVADALAYALRFNRGRKRFQMLHEGEQIFLDEVPVIPVYWYVHSSQVRTSVKNWKESPLNYRCYKAMEVVPNAEDELPP